MERLCFRCGKTRELAESQMLQSEEPVVHPSTAVICRATVPIIIVKSIQEVGKHMCAPRQGKGHLPLAGKGRGWICRNYNIVDRSYKKNQNRCHQLRFTGSKYT